MSAKHREKAWIEFVGWCRTRGLTPLPAHPWTVAAYARWCEVRHRFPSIAIRIRAIARMHLLKCAATPDRHPTVTRTLRTIEMRQRSRAQRAGLFPADELAAAGTAARSKSPAKEREKQRERRSRHVRSLRRQPRLVSRRSPEL